MVLPNLHVGAVLPVDQHPVLPVQETLADVVCVLVPRSLLQVLEKTLVDIEQVLGWGSNVIYS